MRLKKIEKLALSEAKKYGFVCCGDSIWKNFKEAKIVTENLVNLELLTRLEDKHGICYELTDKGKEIVAELEEKSVS